MSRPLTEPSTPLRKVVRVEGDYANYSAPIRPRLSTISLPPHALPSIISQMSSLKESRNSSPHRLRQPSPASKETPSRRSSIISKHTPTRRLSDHLTVRRRRRSSTGVLYDAAFSGIINKDFLRLFSRTLVKERKQRIEEPDDQVFMALDKRHRISSTSPQGTARDFDLSLPLPSEDEMNSPEDLISTAQTPEPASEPHAQTISKPVFKSYLEQILESRNRKSRVVDLPYENESTEESNEPNALRDAINTSKFIIENTLSGLPELWGQPGRDVSSLKLAEPVAFGVMHDAEPDISSNDSSEKENTLPVSEAPYRPSRSPRIGLGNKTPESYDIQFDNIDQMDVPSWEPVPIYNGPESLPAGSDHKDTEEQMYHELDSEKLKNEQSIEEVNAAQSDSDTSQTGIISGHFTVENEELASDDFKTFASPSPGPVTQLEMSPSMSPSLKRLKASEPIISSTLELPKTLLKDFVSVAQRISTSNTSPPRKRQKVTKIQNDIFALISQKSNEFLSQVMQDLSAYADHRDSDQINITDAILLLNRIKSHHRSSRQDLEFPMLAQSVFPLESLVALDNSLQESAGASSRQTNSSTEKSALKNSSYIDD